MIYNVEWLDTEAKALELDVNEELLSNIKNSISTPKKLAEMTHSLEDIRYVFDYVYPSIDSDNEVMTKRGIYVNCVDSELHDKWFEYTLQN